MTKHEAKLKELALRRLRLTRLRAKVLIQAVDYLGLALKDDLMSSEDALMWLEESLDEILGGKRGEAEGEDAGMAGNGGEAAAAARDHPLPR